jgi:hypothetical protein
MRFHPIFFIRTAMLVCSAFFAVSGYSVPVSPLLLALDFEGRDTVELAQFEAAGNDIKIQHPRGGEQIRSAAQSFAWGFDQPLTGVGVQVAGATVWAADAKQDYELRVYSYDPAGKPPIVEPVAVFVFQMTASLAKAGHWLYVEFPEPLRLDPKKGHVFQFAAVSPGGSILALKSSHGAGNPYAKGIGAQVSSNALTVPTAGGSWDYAFFLTSAQPASRSDAR